MAKRKEEEEGIADQVLGKVGKLIPGLASFFKKAERSRTFGPKMKEICKEIERRFGHLKDEDRDR